MVILLIVLGLFSGYIGFTPMAQMVFSRQFTGDTARGVIWLFFLSFVPASVFFFVAAYSLTFGGQSLF